MTTIKIDLPEEQAEALTAKASAQGLTLEEWFLEVAEHHAPAASEADLQRTDPEEWARRFHAWVESHDPDTPVLSDEAMSRESIYPDRF